MSTHVKIAGLHIDHIEKIEMIKEENTETIAQSAVSNFMNGVVAGFIGQAIPLQNKTEAPMTRSMASRIAGIKSHGTIQLTAVKTEKVASSCWGPGFNHPLDFHYHVPYEEYNERNRGPHMC